MREISNLRQEDMVTLTGLSQPFLSMLESGARRLTNIDKIVCLLDGLQAPLELTGLILRSRADSTLVSRATMRRRPADPVCALTECCTTCVILQA